MSIFDWFGSKKLSDVLTKTHLIKVHGVRFEIRKINPVDFMNGSKAVSQLFDVYKTNPEKLEEKQLLSNTNKIKDHYADVFMAAVISPKLVRKIEQSDQGVWVENLFSDWDLVSELYQQIMLVTYGKKKMKSLTSLVKGL
jgi:hypothetical protein